MCMTVVYDIFMCLNMLGPESGTIRKCGLVGHWHFVPRPIIVEARYSRKFCRVVEYPHIRRQLCFEVHYITFTVIQLSTSCGTGTGALCRDRKRRSGRFLMKVSGTYFPATVSHFSVRWFSIWIAP